MFKSLLTFVILFAVSNVFAKGVELKDLEQIKVRANDCCYYNLYVDYGTETIAKYAMSDIDDARLAKLNFENIISEAKKVNTTVVFDAFVNPMDEKSLVPSENLCK